MIYRISDIFERLGDAPAQRLAVAAAADADVLSAVAEAQRLGIVEAVLYGDPEAIEKELNVIGADSRDWRIAACTNDADAALQAVRSVSSGENDILMKGLLPSADFLRAVLNRECGIRKPGSVLSSVAVLELMIEGERRLLFLTDPGFIPLPDLETKVTMIRNTVERMHLLGYEDPKIAVLSAMETVNPKILSSVEGKELETMNRDGVITGCTVCGPLSMDLAISPRSAAHKKFTNPVAGRADCILVPSLEVGNAVLKSISYLTECTQAGFVCGTERPVVFTSRSDTARTKLNTIALAAYLSWRDRHEQ